MMYRAALPMMALLLAGGCSANDATGPTAKLTPTTAVADREGERGGNLHVRKNCDGYAGAAGQSCTIMHSNLKLIPKDTKIVYTSGVVGALLESEITIYPPGDGNSVGTGYVSLNLASQT